ncbi:SGNH/GDSL hydrolase family protein [Thermocaproicibacter melissae]|uniref:SGNH/GDSL hydrolase family protein n=1 Tax=Thermocaproicibacter melissae TaxID=2966552 RepID=UPI003A0FBE33
MEFIGSKNFELGGGENDMVLNNEQLKKIYYGAYSFAETEDGYLQAFQYSKAQMDYFAKASIIWYERCSASAAKTLEFVTEATKISFDYKIIWMGSQDSFELCVDGLITDIVYVKDIKEEGTISFSLEGKKKNVIIYLPADATVVIKNFEINADIMPVKKGPKVLWLGDSITQGYGPLRSGNTYVSVANRLLGYDIINQGIGGYIYDKNSLMKMEGYKPDKIIVALGTNQYGTKTMKDVEEYYEVLTEIYKDTPILCITPIWRGDNLEGIPTLISFCNKIKDIVKKYKSVSVVDGFELVPHLPEYYLDNLHPNQLGSEVYGRNLVRAIEKLGF